MPLPKYVFVFFNSISTIFLRTMKTVLLNKLNFLQPLASICYSVAKTFLNAHVHNGSKL